MLEQNNIVGNAYDAEALPRLYDRVADLERVYASGSRGPVELDHRYFVWLAIAKGRVPVVAHAMWTGNTYRLSAEAFMGATPIVMALRVGAMSFRGAHDPFGEPWRPATRAWVRESYERWLFRHGLEEDWTPLRDWLDSWVHQWTDANPLTHPLYFLSIPDLADAERIVREEHEASTLDAPAKPPEPAQKEVLLPDRFTSKQLAARLGFREQTLRRWRREGKGPRWHKPENGRVYYLTEDVLRWEREQVAPGYDDTRPRRSK